MDAARGAAGATHACYPTRLQLPHLLAGSVGRDAAVHRLRLWDNRWPAEGSSCKTLPPRTLNVAASQGSARRRPSGYVTTSAAAVDAPVAQEVEEDAEDEEAAEGVAADMALAEVPLPAASPSKRVASGPDKEEAVMAPAGERATVKETTPAGRRVAAKETPKASKVGSLKTCSKNKAAPMSATVTKLVKRVWLGYFFGAKKLGKEMEEASAAAAVGQESADDANDEDRAEGAAEEMALTEVPLPVASPSKRDTKKAGKTEGKGAGVKASIGKSTAAAKLLQPEAQLSGPAIKTDASGRTLYRSARIGNLVMRLGQVVSLHLDAGACSNKDMAREKAGMGKGEEVQDMAGSGPLGLVTSLFKDADGNARVQVRTMVPASRTALSDAGDDWELFACEDLKGYALAEVYGVVNAKYLSRAWKWELRPTHLQEDAAFRKRNEEACAAGQAVQYIYRLMYCPGKGMFCTMPESMIRPSGRYVEAPAKPVPLALLPDGQGLVVEGVEYRIGDFMYLDPDTFRKEGCSKAVGKKPMASMRNGRKLSGNKQEEEQTDEDEETQDVDPRQAPAYACKSGKHKGSNDGLNAFAIAQLTSITSSGADSSSETCGRTSSTAARPLPMAIKVRRFHRPEDVGPEQAYVSDWAEVYAGPDEETSIGPDKIMGKCSVRLCHGQAATQEGSSRAGASQAPWMFNNQFWCTGTFNPSHPGAGVTALPATLCRGAAYAAPAAPEIKITKCAKAARGRGTQGKAAVAAAKARRKASQQPSAEELVEKEEVTDNAVVLKALDTFAGCGGLSEGMHLACVADTRWGIENDPAAAAAFKRNNKDAKVFCMDCNVLLHAAMKKAGVDDQCEACEDCREAAAALSEQDRAALPQPGEVEFIMGNPPCQGFSGMNRFNEGDHSLAQNSLVLSFLSYCEFYRPRYFLMETVRNFVSHNKSLTFRFTLRTLLEMGYQVRFGVLNAGNYGVPQSRSRTFIWAAAPGEQLPGWPSPVHAFRSTQQTVNLPGGVRYTAVPSQIGAPLRAVTVKDAIQDLPPIANGHASEMMPYSVPAASAYQRNIRGDTEVLYDHMCKEMHDLNLERCRCIPKGQPGTDWRALQEVVRRDPDRKMYKGEPLVPDCLVNTADRHNGWRGLFGRLDPNGHFPTATPPSPHPQPMGKVGQVLHPHQDRIVSVREYARAQGFPDRFLFSGSI